MATIVAQANGNWSNPATWAGGVVPGAGDTAQTGNYIVTIDASVTCTLNPTGSGRFQVNSGGITITGDLVMQSSHTGGGLHATHGSGTVALTGTVTGGAGNNAYGAVNAGAGTLTVGAATGGAGNNAYGAYNQAAGTLTAGAATGGAGNNAYGAANTGAGTLTVGTATGGAGYSALGAYNAAAGTMTVGTATGGAGSGAYGAYNAAAAGTLHVDLAIGNDYGPGGPHSNHVPGVYGGNAAASVTTVKRTQSGAYGQAAIGGSVLLLDDINNSAQFRTAHNGATKTLTDAAATDWPAESDVRNGVEYDNGDKTGTAHIPAAANVALGIPVDATVGTAVLTAAAVTAGVWDAARSGHAGAGTFGATDEWAGSVDTNAIATAAAYAVWNENMADHLGQTTTGGRLNLAAQAGPVGDMIEAVGYNRFKTTALENMPAAVGLATANLDAQLAGLPTAAAAAILAAADSDPISANVTYSAGVALGGRLAEASAVTDMQQQIDEGFTDTNQIIAAVLEDTGTTLPGLLAVGVGPGSSTGYYTDTIDNGTNPLDGVRVQLYTAPNRVGPAYEAYTNALGVFEMWPDPGVYYRWLDLAGYNFSQDVAVTVTEP